MENLAAYCELIRLLHNHKYAPLGLHGAKSKWSTAILQQGLIRPSAGWFILQFSTVRELRATLILTIYFALSLQVCQELVWQPEQNGYSLWFEQHPDMVPILLLFSSASNEIAFSNRYQCLVTECYAQTVPYTKTIRARQHIPSTAFCFLPIITSLAEITFAEYRMLLQPINYSQSDIHKFHLALKCKENGKVFSDNSGTDECVNNKLGHFCATLADLLTPRIVQTINRSSSLSSLKHLGQPFEENGKETIYG